MYTPNNIEKNKTSEIFSSLYFEAPTSPLSLTLSITLSLTLSTLRGLIFANTYFREVKKSTIREYLFSRINLF